MSSTPDDTTIASQATIALPPSGSGAPVGVFDSGVGGLSVLRAIRRELPAESLIYCADSRYAPYGERSEAFIVDRSLAIGEWLIAEGAKTIVVACNTATTIAIGTMRATLSVPIIGVEPGVKPAVAASRSGIVAILATAGTLRSASFRRLVASHAGDCHLICTAGLGLVEAIESGDIDSPTVATLLESYLRPIIDAGADTLALGCTHYPFLIPLIERIAGNRLHIVDNSTPVARQLGRQLDAHALSAPTLAPRRAANRPRFPSLRLVATGAPSLLGMMAEKALGVPCDAQLQDIASSLTSPLTSSPTPSPHPTTAA